MGIDENLGDSAVADVVLALKASGYGGRLVIEQDTARLDPTGNAGENRIYFEKLLTQDGI